MKKIWSILFVASLLSATVDLVSCKKSNGSSPPAVTSISPTQGEAGAVVTIRGTGFGSVIDSVKVTVNGVNASVEAVTDTEIKFRVPLKAGSGLINVRIGSTGLPGVQFTYILSVKDFEGTIWTGDSKYGNYPTVPYVLEVGAGGNLVWHDEAQDLPDNGILKVENGQLYFTFISSGSTVKADITDDHKLKNIQNNIYNATNDDAKQWRFLSGELDTLTEMALDNTTWEEVTSNNFPYRLTFLPDNGIDVLIFNTANAKPSKYTRKAGFLRFELNWYDNKYQSGKKFAIIRPDGKITVKFDGTYRMFEKRP
jgi:hypothetical protein